MCKLKLQKINEFKKIKSKKNGNEYFLFKLKDINGKKTTVWFGIPQWEEGLTYLLEKLGYEYPIDETLWGELKGKFVDTESIKSENTGRNYTVIKGLSEESFEEKKDIDKIFPEEDSPV